MHLLIWINVWQRNKNLIDQNMQEIKIVDVSHP